MLNKGIIYFKNSPCIFSTYTVVGPKEKQSELGKFYDLTLDDDKFGESTYEKAECKMLSTAVGKVMRRSGLDENSVDYIISGDLLNQIISANFMARDFKTSYFGVYSACSSITESMIIGAQMIDGGYAKNIICSAGSHYSTAERQYRYPLELGSVRPPQAQWTATGAGAYCLKENIKGFPKITMAVVGRVIDFGVTDANNMGAAMAPAAADTIFRLFEETNTTADDYDLIVTGDLGALGSRLLKHLLFDKGYDLTNHVDCGELIYNMDEQDFQGGSGAGCGTVVMASYIYPKIKRGEFKKIVFAATGALLSTLSIQQGESIPSISHAIVIEWDKG